MMANKRSKISQASATGAGAGMMCCDCDVLLLRLDFFSLKLALHNSVGTSGCCMEHLPPKRHKDTELSISGK